MSLVTVVTCSGLSVRIPPSYFIDQVKTDKCWEINTKAGLIKSDLPVPKVPIREVSPPKKEKIKVAIPTSHREELISASDCPSAGGQIGAGINHKFKESIDPERYTGEMLWSAKTNPEIRITHGDRVVKEVDEKNMYRRR